MGFHCGISFAVFRTHGVRGRDCSSVASHNQGMYDRPRKSVSVWFDMMLLFLCQGPESVLWARVYLLSNASSIFV